MKFADFKSQKIEQAASLPPPPTFDGKAKTMVISDVNCDPFYIESFEALMCPICAGDLTVRVSPSGCSDILYYKCTDNSMHTYLRLLRGSNRIQGPGATLDAASRLLSATTDHMGRPAD